MNEGFSQIPAKKITSGEVVELTEIQTPDYRVSFDTQHVPETSTTIQDTDQYGESQYSYQESGYQTMPIEEKSFRTERPEEGVDNSIFLKEILKEGRPLSKYEKEAFLNQESLVNLSMEEYVALWKQLKPHFASHITRQGYREVFSTDHSGGLGEFHNSFVEMLKDDKKLRSTFEVEKPEGLNQLEEELQQYLQTLDITSLEADESGAETLPKLWKVIKKRLTASMGSAPKVPDDAALHMATERVLDSYGAETENQVFCVFPSDVISSQFSFAFNGGHFGQSFNSAPLGSEARWNDAFIWNKEQPFNTSITLDAGIVFLPKSTPVNPLTGSKYLEYAIEDQDGQGIDKKIKATLPESTISAEEYWREYFLNNPELSPKHVVFYDGSPTLAVQEFMKDNGIVSDNGEINGTEEEFNENHIKDMHEDPFVENIENAAFAHGANALIKYFKEHPELRYEDYIGAEDIEEMQALLVE